MGFSKRDVRCWLTKQHYLCFLFLALGAELFPPTKESSAGSGRDALPVVQAPPVEGVEGAHTQWPLVYRCAGFTWESRSRASELLYSSRDRAGG